MKIVILGASGDLAKRKLFPNLTLVNLNGVKVIAYARSDLKDSFHKKISEYGTYTKSFLNNIEYIQGSYEDIVLKDYDINEEYIFYFSVPPSAYLTLLKSIEKFPNSKIAIEKPFATDAQNYKLISQNKHLILIDHYLLKPIVICMPNIRDRIVLKHFNRVDFIMKEELGIEGRTYFDATGIVKDMLQNHLMVLYTTLLGNDRVDTLKNSKIVNYLLGQYNGYEDELGRPSDTETYAMMLLENKKYKDTIFTFQVGKGLDEKRTQIRIKYIKEHYRKVIEQTLNDSGAYKHVALESINDVELVIDVAKNRVHLEVTTEQTESFCLFDKAKIKQMNCDLTGELVDHALIFDCLINNKEFSSTAVDEGMLQWDLFGNIKKGLVYYDKGEAMPKEAFEMFESVNESYEK